MALRNRRRPLVLGVLGLAVALMASVLVLVAGPTATGQVISNSSVPASCKRPAQGFTPTAARLPALDRTVKVIQVRRTSSGAVGAGPVTEEGKWLMAMDPHTKPSSRKGSVILSGHTWPDGSALGNAMLRKLQKGHRVVLGGKDRKRACYRIIERAQYPADRVPNRKAFRYWGPEQLVIVTCSGKRRGPGDWSHRTIWYAVPEVPQRPPSSPPPSSPPPSGSDGGLLGGILGGLLGS